jgi:hypothetical protein
MTVSEGKVALHDAVSREVIFINNLRIACSSLFRGLKFQTFQSSRHKPQAGSALMLHDEKK